ncbi:MAG: hypothetical protein WAQ25_04625 [Candidatus Saccharimonas sp.]
MFDNHSSQGDVFHHTDGTTVLPEVEIVQLKPHLSSDKKHLELWVNIKNRSAFEIEITRASLLNTSTSPGRFIRPGESHETNLYSGDTPTNDNVRHMNLQIKVVKTGDYFEADFTVDYSFEQDGDEEYYVPDKAEANGHVRSL